MTDLHLDNQQDLAFDIDLINGIYHEKKFCFEVESSLDKFMNDPDMYILGNL